VAGVRSYVVAPLGRDRLLQLAEILGQIEGALQDDQDLAVG
jgi:hypothetical protein